jgi:bifunctional non-homologous end joining protein LigD
VATRKRNRKFPDAPDGDPAGPSTAPPPSAPGGRPSRRGRRKSDRPDVIGLARQYRLSPIVDADAARLDAIRAAPARYRLELAWDGHRVQASRLGTEVRLAAADFRDWAETFAAIAHVLARLPCTSLVIEGHLCALDDAGRPSFELLRERAATKDLTNVTLVAWDLLHLDGEDLRARPLAERAARLATLVSAAPGRLRVSEPLPGELDAVLAALRGHGIRGLVARGVDDPAPAPDERAWACIPTVASEPIAWTRTLSPPPPLTNATKVLYPRDGVTKADVVAYYADVAPVMLAHLRERPVVCQRWPDGIDDFTWYQHRVPPRAPDYLRAVWVDGVRRVLIDNPDALLWMVNQAALTYHGFGSRLATLAEADWAMIDLDPGDATTWADTVEVAIAVRRSLELLELPSVVKTSGQKGLHVLVPCAPGQTFAQAEALAFGVARMVAALLPGKVTLDMEKEKRGGRLLVDHKQFAAKTLVAPYSLRATDGAPASCPVRWDEVTPALDPRGLGLRTIRARLDRHGDLAAPLLGGGVALGTAIATIRASLDRA